MLQQNDPATGRPAAQDPYPRYEQLRSEDPVHWNDGAQVWVLTRYQDVIDAIRDPRLSSTGISAVMRKAGSGEEVQDLERTFLDMMLFADPPDHTRLRSLANKAFTPRVLERMRSQIQAWRSSLTMRETLCGTAIRWRISSTRWKASSEGKQSCQG